MPANQNDCLKTGPSRFARVWPLAGLMLLLLGAPVPAQSIRLEDVTAGGDGSGNAPAANTGVDPRTGQFTTSYAAGRLIDTDGVTPSPVPDSPYIDSVFILKGRVPTADDGCGGCYVQYTTQSGVQLWLDDSEEWGSGWNFILKNRVGGVSEPGIRVGGRDFYTTAIGLHAAMGITFNLDQLRARHGDAAVGCFSTFWGMDDCSIGLVTLLAMVSNDVSGVTDIRQRTFAAGQGELLQMQIPREARYLTLVTLAAGGDNCDHATFARPVITPLPCPQDSAPWLWSVWPSRISPDGEYVAVEGEFLREHITLRVGGFDLLDQQLWSSESRSGLVRPLAPGVYDLEAVDFTNVVVARLPGAVEVTPPPVLTAILPSKTLHDRQILAQVLGQNLHSDMEVQVDDVGFDGVASSLIDPQFRSEQLIVGYLPPMDTENGLGPKTVLLRDQGRLHLFEGLLTYVDVGIEKVQPNTVSTGGGTEVTFVGLGFTPQMTYRIGSLPLTEVEILDSGRARGKSPPLPEGLHHAELLDAGGQLIYRLPSAFAAVPPAPLAIVSITPSRVFTLGGAALTVRLTGPHGGGTPRAGGQPLANVEVIDPVTLRGGAPPLEPGFHDVDLVDGEGTVLAALPSGLEVLADNAVSITGVQPAVVSTAGGTEVTITGTGFADGYVPRIGGVPLVGARFLDAMRVAAVSPPLEAGLHDVTVQSGRLILAVRAGAVQAAVPNVPQGMHLGHVRPARISSDGRIRFIGSHFPADVVPRIGGIPLQDFRAVSPCRFEGSLTSGGEGGGGALLLPPGLYKADLFRPGFGVVAELEELVEVAGAGDAPRPSHIVSAPVLADGSTRLFVFGNDFLPQTAILIGVRPLVDASFVSDELIVGNAPPLAPGEAVGLRDVTAQDSRGGSTLANGLRYVEPGSTSTPFVRGDPNQDGRADLSDAVYSLGYLFLGNPSSLACLDAGDADSSGTINITDPIYLLQFLFLGGPRPSLPFPACGLPIAPILGCGSFAPCGGGAGGGASLYANVKLLAESPASAFDPRLVELEAEGGEIVVRDPPGGEEVRAGDVITGFTPLHLDAVHNGVSYMLKVEEEIAGSCLSASAEEKVFRVRPALLSEVVIDGEVSLHQQDLFGARFSYSADKVPKAFACLNIEGGGGGEQGGGGSGVFFDFDLPPFQVLDIQQGPAHIQAGFYQCKVRYNSGANIGFGIGAGELTRFTLFSGLLLESEVEFWIDAKAFGQIRKEVSLIKLTKGTIIFVGPVPILLTAEAELFAGVNLEAGIHMWVDAGVATSYKAGLGFEFDGESIRNISGFEEPTASALPDTPVFELDGFVKVKGYVRPELKFFGGLFIKALTGEIQIRPEVYVAAHVEGATHPVPCYSWGIDAGAKASMSTLVELFGFDLLDTSFELFNGEWPDLIGGSTSCKAPPVVVLNHREETVGNKLHVHLDASGSHDPDGGPLEFRWDFDNDGWCDRNTGSNPRTTYIYDPARESPCRREFCTHQIRLRATDDEDVFKERKVSFTTQGSEEIVDQITYVEARVP